MTRPSEAIFLYAAHRAQLHDQSSVVGASISGGHASAIPDHPTHRAIFHRKLVIVQSALGRAK
jgi:hypothetical protein